ncbi:MAG: tyrosine-type recombinase/integrase [Nocardioides sp.]
MLWLESRGASKRNAWASARVFFGWAHSAGLVDVSPTPPTAARRSATKDQPALPGVWAEALSAYACSCRAVGQGVRSLETRMTYLRRFARTHASPWPVTYDDLVRWLASHEHWSPETRKSARSALVAFYAHAVQRGVLTESPAARLRRVRVPRAVPRPAPTDALQSALLDADDRSRLLILLAAYAGLRVAEISQVRPAKDVQEGLLYVVGKGGHQRVVPLHPLVAIAIEKELERRRSRQLGTGFARGVITPDPDGWLFPSPCGGHLTPGHVSVLVSRALPDRWTAHTLRHRFASEAYSSERDIRAVQELLGHASLTTTQRYTAVPPERLVAAVMAVR